MLRRRHRVAAALAVVVLGLGGCGGGGGTADSVDTTASSGSTSDGGTDPAGPTAGGADPGPSASPGPDGCDPSAVVASWPLRRRVAALVMVGVDPSGPGEATTVVEDHHVGGIFVGGDATDLLTGGVLPTLRAGAPLGLMVAVDEEGGRVQRIEGLDGDVPSAREMAATMTTDEVRDLAARRGGVMAEHGVTVDLAPVVDVSDQPDRTVIGDRSWSDDPATVTAYAGAYADGLLEAGVAPVLKHFPGHGEASADSHEGAASTPPLDVLRDRDLLPYAELLPALGTRTAVMLGHLDVPGLTEPGVPASLSPATVRLLRDDHGFAGVVMTDDLAGMAAVTDRLAPEDAAVDALAAGVDVVLLSGADVGHLLDVVEAAVADGELTEATIDAAVARVLAYKGVDPCTVAG